MKAYKPDADPVLSLISRYLLTGSVPPRNNDYCPILTQYTASSPRNEQLSQLDLVQMWGKSIIIAVTTL